MEFYSSKGMGLGGDSSCSWGLHSLNFPSTPKEGTPGFFYKLVKMWAEGPGAWVGLENCEHLSIKNGVRFCIIPPERVAVRIK